MATPITICFAPAVSYCSYTASGKGPPLLYKNIFLWRNLWVQAEGEMKRILLLRSGYDTRQLTIYFFLFVCLESDTGERHKVKIVKFSDLFTLPNLVDLKMKRKKMHVDFSFTNKKNANFKITAHTWIIMLIVIHFTTKMFSELFS